MLICGTPQAGSVHSGCGAGGICVGAGGKGGVWWGTGNGKGGGGGMVVKEPKGVRIAQGSRGEC